MSSTFGSFGVARLGIYAAQKGLDVTGNNITNINTPGYTRQRLDQVSLISSVSDKYFNQNMTRVGQGVLTTGVSQLRDPGLDLIYREAQADLGAAGGKLEGLGSLASILDEVGKGDGEQDDGVILSQLNDLRDLISKAVTNGIQGYDSLIRESASALCTYLNSTAKKLENLQGTYETYLDQDIQKVNDILKNIQDLNTSIRDADIRGDDALELRDSRNMLLDELSQYIDIDVKYTMEDLGAGFMVEKLTVTLGTGNQNTLIDGEYATKIGRDPADTNYNIQLYALKDADGNKKDEKADEFVTLKDNDLYGSLQARREILTESGEYATQETVNRVDKNAAVKRGIPYYRNALDSLARELAKEMNKLNNVNDVDIPGKGNLFSAGSDTNETSVNGQGITAANISVSKGWREGSISMIPSRDPGASSGDTSNLAAFLSLFEKTVEFNPNDLVTGAVGKDSPYKGTFEDMLLHIQSTLAEDQMSTSSVYNNYAITANEIYTDRDSLSGVDLNDEATNLMVYQKAYTAACRLMTTLDEALDSLMAM
ncbi:flagellar hook-associated protein FlgK [Ruminococcaceae bacterium AM07-15]|nr:flagellar hook-associated protein FlgK [Ruminococcaceae bacterium AM07-15]